MKGITYLNTFLTLLTKSQHNVLNTKDLTRKIKIKRIPKGSKNFLSCLIYLCTMKLNNKIPIPSITKTSLTELPYLGIKEVHFMFNDKIYFQNDGVTIGSSLGLSFTNTFMTS